MTHSNAVPDGVELAVDLLTLRRRAETEAQGAPWTMLNVVPRWFVAEGGPEFASGPQVYAQLVEEGILIAFSSGSRVRKVHLEALAIANVSLLTGISEDDFDKMVFNSLYEPEILGKFLRLAFGIVGDRFVAEELVQDALLELWEKRFCRTPPREMLPRGSAYYFVRNKALNEKEKRQGRSLKMTEKTIDVRESTHPTPNDDDASEDAAGGGEKDWKRHKTLAVIRQLSDSEQNVISLALSGHSYAEMAMMLGSTEAAVTKKYKRAWERLRTALHQEGLADPGQFRKPYPKRGHS